MPCPFSRAAIMLGAALLALGLGLPASAQAPAQDTGPVVRMDPLPDRPTPPEPPRQRTFTTPEAAVEALIAAMREPGTAALSRVLGHRVISAIPPAEQPPVEIRSATAERLARTPFTVDYLDEARTRARVLFGPERTALPATLTRGPRGWVFDQAATITAMRERRIGVNEANAIRALRALAAAQNAFRRRDMMGDGVLQFAPRIASRPGRTDGLVASDRGMLPGPAIGLNEAFARAEGRPGDQNHRPPGGYAYRILTAQGPEAEGGARSYLVNGRLTEGYAVIAWPVQPGVTGLSTFIMDWRGRIHERELGPGTLAEVARIEAFNPGPGWERVDPAEG